MLPTDLFRIIFVTCAARTYAMGPFRGTCRESLFNKKGEDRVLENHVTASIEVTSDMDCAQRCLRTRGCVSYNYQESGSPLHRCELSDQTSDSKPSDYVIKLGFSYHDAETLVVPECSSTLCQNGGTCWQFFNCSAFFECSCKPEYTGKHCETWFGFNGSKPNLPARSCLNIKLLGQDTGDTRYWIDPANTGNPFTVYCDMTTDGGGWTLIRNVTLLSPTTNKVVALSDYRQITSLTIYQFVTQPGLLELKNDMGFTQIRYFCRKVSTGRVFHVMTAKNDLGFDVVRYFVEMGHPCPTACNSFVRLPNDNSIIATNCDKWGDLKTNKWGHSAHYGIWKAYNHIVYMQGIHLVGFVNGFYYCDDTTQSGQNGDVWKMFVR